MRSTVAIYPGSFDPITNGHLDILERALKIFDRVIIAVTRVESKNALFSIHERVALLKKTTASLKNASVESFDGLLVEYARRKKATAIIRGLRVISDFEYEFQMALMNRNLSRKSPQRIETVFLMPDEKYTYISSTLVKEVARLGGDVHNFVPDAVRAELMRRFPRKG